MVKFLNLPEDLRKQLIEQVNIRTGMSVKAIEKDWWVTLVLKALFSLPMQEHFIFKGGTSLSKAWKLIERFSEDIDIALAPEAFGREYLKVPSHSYVKRLKREGCEYTSTVIQGALQKQLSDMDIPAGLITMEAEAVNPRQRDKDPQTIFVHYPSLYDPNPYIADTVKIEFGVRSLKEPFAVASIRTIIAEKFPNPSYNDELFIVRAVEPRKTFLEKLFLLHEKFVAPEQELIVAERQSRHLIDIERMAARGIFEQVLADADLYTTLVEHRRHYVRLKNINYDGMNTKGLWFIPPPSSHQAFRQDHASMRIEMIYEAIPDFDELLDKLKDINARINRHDLRNAAV